MSVKKVAPLKWRLPRGMKSPFGDPCEGRRSFEADCLENDADQGSGNVGQAAIGFERSSCGSRGRSSYNDHCLPRPFGQPRGATPG